MSVSLIPKFPVSNGMIFYKFNECDLEHYACEAVKLCYHYNGSPDFYEIWDNFHEIIIESEVLDFFMEGIPIQKGWINEATLANILDILKIEYVSFNQVVSNECQNVIMWEWITNEYRSNEYKPDHNQFGNGESNSPLLSEFCD